MLCRIVYSSQAAPDLLATELESLLARARASNESDGITGALIFVDGVFMQVLEGQRDAVEALMARIASDTRHSEVTVFHRADIEQRAFASWCMACLSPDADEVAAWAGLDGGTTIGELLADMRREPELLPKVVVSIVETLADQRPDRHLP